MTWLTSLLVAAWNVLPSVVKTVALGTCEIIHTVAGVTDKTIL